jgi:trypsin
MVEPAALNLSAPTDLFLPPVTDISPDEELGLLEQQVVAAERAVKSSRYDDALVLLDEVSIVPARYPDLALRALLADSWARMYRGELDEALTMLQTAKQVAHRPGFTTSTARAPISKSLSSSPTRSATRPLRPTSTSAPLRSPSEGKWLMARTYAERAKELCARAGDRGNVGRVLKDLGGIIFFLGEPDEGDQQRPARSQARIAGARPAGEAEATFVAAELSQLASPSACSPPPGWHAASGILGSGFRPARIRNPLRTAIVALAAALTVVTAGAATGSTPDGAAHPYVGARIVEGSVACSGILIAPAVFATAGHCTADLPEGAPVSVSFDSSLEQASWTLLGGSAHTHPGYVGKEKDPRDIAVVVLDVPSAIVPAVLAPANSVSALERKLPVRSVGYGYSGQNADGSFIYDGLRRNADSPWSM